MGCGGGLQQTEGWLLGFQSPWWRPPRMGSCGSNWTVYGPQVTKPPVTSAPQPGFSSGWEYSPSAPSSGPFKLCIDGLHGPRHL